MKVANLAQELEETMKRQKEKELEKEREKEAMGQGNEINIIEYNQGEQTGGEN